MKGKIFLYYTLAGLILTYFHDRNIVLYFLYKMGKSCVILIKFVSLTKSDNIVKNFNTS